MPVSELKVAVNSVVELMRKTQIQQAVSHFRTDLVRNQVTQSKDHLRSASQQLVAGYTKLGAMEKRICSYMHLEQLGSPQYWDDILNVTKGLEVTRAEVVQLYSRVMFAVNHLPGFVQMLESESTNLGSAARPGHSLLKIRLVDAGERAADPDRISRTIDGIDMVYSACASLAKKPVSDLSLLSVHGGKEKHIVFEGDGEGVNAVREVIDSMADEIAEIEDPEQFDPDQLVNELPVFDDIQTLQQLGTLKGSEAKDISDTMHEGCLLVMESGVMLEPQPDAGGKLQAKVVSLPVERNSASTDTPVQVKPAASRGSAQNERANAQATDVHPTVTLKPNPAAAKPVHKAPESHASSQAESAHQPQKDPKEMTPLEFYEQYLKEKNKMQTNSDNPMSGMEQSSKLMGSVGGAEKTDALNDLILDLDRITNK